MKSIVLALLATACSGASRTPAPTPSPPTSHPSGRAERISITDLEAYSVEDGYIVAPNDGTVISFGRPKAEVDAVLATAGLATDTIRLDIQCLLVKAGDRVILFDAGAGDASYAKAGLLPRSLARAGVTPAAVTDVFISHAHGDHLGGLVTKDKTLAFPSAAIHMSAPEWAALQRDVTSDDDKRFVATITPKVAPFEPDAQVLPMVKAVATHGHTVGHSAYEIGTGADKLFYLGDLVHHSVISLRHPDWSPQVDGDQAAAAAIRQQTLAKLAAARTRAFAVHFPYPGVGHLVAETGGYAWR